VLLAAACHAYRAGDATAVQAAITALLEDAETGGWRAVLEQVVTARLGASITWSWRHGWQPADLVRLARRRLTGAHVRLLADAIAADLGTYPATTVDPRWSAQLTEADARVWWPGDQTYLQARSQLPGRTWTAELTLAVQVLCLMNGLPVLEQFGPVPGTARPPVESGRGQRPDVDERILSRIRALLAKAESTTSAAEAEAFTAGAQERMARHSINLAMLSATDPDRAGKPTGRRISIDSPYESAKASLLQAVSQANRCRAVWSSTLGFSTVIGFEADLDVVETLFTSLLVQVVTTMTRAATPTATGSRSRTRSFRSSFLSAYAQRISERLTGIVRSETGAATTRPGGADLLPVLASRNQAVEDTISTLFPTITTRKTSSVYDAEGWHRGQAAADLAALNPGPEVSGSDSA
jgi:hypothetical protein